jgi:alkylhydroperoxidase/carboxymuconolactone decarboxylase family protein YurZ
LQEALKHIGHLRSAILSRKITSTSMEGAKREELVEAVFVAAALRAGGAATHGAMALKFFDGAE